MRRIAAVLFSFFVLFSLPIVVSVVVLASPLAISAQTLGVGCRLSTVQDKAEMAARGIPQKFEVCPADEKILGIGRDFEQWYAQLKAQLPCNKNTCTLSCRTRNTGAQVCGPTATRWNSIGCHPNNRTAIFPTVSHGFAAHIELLRRYCGERGRWTIGGVVQQWTATAGDRSAYANFVSRNAGIPVNQVYNPNDIDLVARLAMAMACFEAGSLPYSADELKQGLIMASGGARVPVPSNVGQLLNESMTGGYATNPSYSPNSHPGSWTYPLSSISGNNYNPPRQSSGFMSGAGNASYTSSPFANLSPVPIGGTAQIGQPTAGTSSNGTTSYAPTSASSTRYFASSIVVQPRVVSSGDTVVVSWTSGGTSACQIFASSQSIGEGMEGSRTITTSSAPSDTSMTFTLRCRTLQGTLDEHIASVTLR